MPEPNSGCWLWLKSTGSHGYGQGYMSDVFGDTVVVAHRMSYLGFVGRIPKQRVIDHKCRNRVCVNPDHLECVTHFANIRRAFGNNCHGNLQSTTQCPRGHEGYRRSNEGKWVCNECKRQHNRVYGAQRRALKRAANLAMKSQ